MLRARRVERAPPSPSQAFSEVSIVPVPLNHDTAVRRLGWDNRERGTRSSPRAVDRFAYGCRKMAGIRLAAVKFND